MNENLIIVKVAPKDIDFVNRTIEACEGIGVVSTPKDRKGYVYIHVTPDTRGEVIEVLKNMPSYITIENIE